jgi:hypothetical protein
VSGPVGLTWDELDELADFTEGVLDGPAHERVAALVRDDERWALAYASLVETTPAVRATLQAAGQVPLSVPEDVITRLDAALATQATPPPTPRQVPAGPGRGRSTASTRPAGERPGRGRRSRRIAGAVTGALVVVAVVAFGALALRGTVSLRTATNSAGDAPANGYAPPEAAPTQSIAAGDAVRVTLLATGTDYRPETLHLLVDAPPSTPTFQMSDGKAEMSATNGLAGLETSEGLSACLAAVLLDHHGQVMLADYARFEGQPALVLVVTSGKTSTVVAVGMNCGRPGPDELAAVDVP